MNIARHLKALSLAGSVLMAAAPAALAQSGGQSTEPPSSFDKIEKSLSEAATEAIDYLKSFVPYSMPEVQDNGDIIIRRDKPPAATDGSTPSTPSTGTATGSETKI
ncbi:hypothetical protein Snov_2181 [Ancylobacter novellus DSM 506]|uniref:Uncharacterized protein n=1 Tax=Ancylobacter novellus (strain ATCC 8093 / DSM 506 / JCM 20403 / CCM 1077 / IAM 12100 / NBRC 12443 / NCIMB 10456) TaxID=639283 RepID=D7A1B9_ANCN5|nr:hypothetical protein [Ancylobacter novellus]ADH89477.1 hypothetical protein Snov_2181 [Ancylobacter novellus DSM 506]